jgi:YgiT-type zinc finger domain-containing protein
MTHCRIAGCPGEYERREILHVERHNGEPVVIDRVPADVCGFCGDVLLAWETVGRLEELARNLPQPLRMIPLYDYSSKLAQPVGGSVREGSRGE